jgi:hypothetical protein
MKKEKEQGTIVTLKSALKKVTLSAVLAGGLLVPAAQAADGSNAQQTLEQRVKAVSETLRKKLTESQRNSDSAREENVPGTEGLIAQWGNSWGDWNNWRNWNNWNNWRNWGNWGNWINW